MIVCAIANRNELLKRCPLPCCNLLELSSVFETLGKDLADLVCDFHFVERCVHFLPLREC